MKENIKKGLIFMLTLVLVLCQNGFLVQAGEITEPEDINQMIAGDYPLNSEVEIIIENEGYIYEDDDVKVRVEAKSDIENTVYEYCFAEKEQKDYKLLREFDDDNEYIFSAGAAGSYVLRVLLRMEDGTLSMQEKSYEVLKKEETVTDNSEKEQESESFQTEDNSKIADSGSLVTESESIKTAVTLSVSADKSGTQPSGSVVTLTGKAGGGSGSGYEYRFTETYNGNATTVQNYSEDPSYEYTAKGNGTHKFTVAVRDSSGNATSAVYTVEVKEEALTLSVSADKSGTQPSGSVVTLTGKAGGGSGSGYEYRFTETYNGNATTVQNYSEDPSYEYTAKGNGTHKFTVAVRDSSGNAISAVYTVEVKEAALTLSISADKSGTQPSGSVVTLTGKAGGGSGSGYEYRFTETYNGNATTVQNYSEDPSYEYTAKGNGTHKFTVAVRDSSGNAISAVYTVEVKEAALTLSISADKSGTQPSGSVVTLTGKAGGGSGSGYEYRFTETYNGNATTVQNYSEDPSYEYTAKGNGTHKFTVAVRDSSGNAISAVYTVEVKEAALTLSISADKSGTQPSGSVVTLTGKAGGGSGSGYEYRFTETYNGNATTVQNYSEDPSYEYTAKGNGTHKFTVAVRDSSGNAISAVYTVEVKEAALTLSVSADKSGTQPSGSVVTLTGKAGGGSGSGYEYRFTETYNGNATTVQNYSEDPSYEYTAKGNGTHKFTVAVRDSSGNAISAVYTVEVKETALTVSLSSSKGELISEGAETILEAKVFGGSGDYKYCFREYYSGSTSVVQEYSSKEEYTFVADPGKTGLHEFTVEVEDSVGNSATATYSITVNLKPLTLSVSSNRSTNEVLGTQIMLTATAGAGDGAYEYRFTETYEGIAETKQAYSEKNTYSFTAVGIGEHTFTVAVKDSAGRSMSAVYKLTVEPEAGKKLFVSVESDQPAKVQDGTEITLVASSSGGYGGTQYRFTETYQGNSVTKQAYSENNTYSFQINGLGTHKFTIAAKDKEGQSNSASYLITVYSDKISYGIDVSAYQGDIDWSKVRNDGISFAMIRVLTGKMGALDVDPYFNKNIAGATKNGIAVGIYRYGYAMTPEQAQREAKMAIEAIKDSGYNTTYPIAYDVEDLNTQGTLSKDELTEIIKAFRGVVENNGYQFMIYSSKSWLETKIDMDEFADVDVWLARWFNDKTPNHDHGYNGPGTVTIWQYSDVGRVSGISGYVDMNVGYKSY